MSLLNNNQKKGKKGNKNQKNSQGSKFIPKPHTTTTFTPRPHKAGGMRGS
ncbi:MAG TPA: hypothetical protein VFP87_07255 [Chitinophagaceae bacterium]|nr:hypothetical protein [Chitinophagaceae bacterium]